MEKSNIKSNIKPNKKSRLNNGESDRQYNKVSIINNRFNKILSNVFIKIYKGEKITDNKINIKKLETYFHEYKNYSNQNIKPLINYLLNFNFWV